MSNWNNCLEIREAFEEAGHTLSLFIDLLTSDIQLTERSRLALASYGRASMEAFERAESQLHNRDDTKDDIS
jgi:hypothetical protein